MHFWWRNFTIILLLCVLSSCGKTLISGRYVTAQTIADQGDLLRQQVATSTFVLTSFTRRQEADNKLLRVYIEGDGFAWVNRHQISGNPTPINPVAMRLASQDPHPSVVYIARPCQYTPLSDDRLCDPAYWSSLRFAEEVVVAVNEVIDYYKEAMHASHVELVGFSGGGAVAALVASRRNDMKGLITVAGNLDHVALHEHHRVSQLGQLSLNAIDVVDDLKILPQLHISGEEDKVVPAFIAKDFGKHMSDCAKIHVVSGQGHHDGWEDHWQRLLSIPRVCQSN